jgi:hypothetical protein
VFGRLLAKTGCEQLADMFTVCMVALVRVETSKSRKEVNGRSLT